MITGIFGLPGVGKTLLASWIANRAVEDKNINVHGFHISTIKHYQRIYTNFPVSGAYKLDFEEIGFAKYENCLMICDELQLFADSRNFKSFGDELKAFFAEHRKNNIDFIWLSQDPTNADKRIRSLSDKLYYIDRTAFNLVRVREILTRFDVQTMTTKGEFSSGINSHYFFAPLLYKYCDTRYIVNPRVMHDVPLIPWFSGSDSAPRVGSFVLPDGQTAEQFTDGLYYADK